MSKAEDKSRTESEENVAERPPYDGPVLEWVTHPVKRRPVVSAAVTLLIFVISWIVYMVMESEFFSILALIVLSASLAKFYFPTKFTVTLEEVRIKTTTQTIRKDWGMFRSCHPDKNGVLLSPFAEQSRLENFRGIYLIFENNRDEVVAFVKKCLEHNKDKTLPETSPQEGSESA